MSDPKPFASLSSGLLARKGAARPAMRPQGFSSPSSGLEDLGWNDMGQESGHDHAGLTPLAPVAPEARHENEDQVVEHPRNAPGLGLSPVASPVHSQQAELAERLADSDEDFDEEFDETAEPYEPEAGSGSFNGFDLSEAEEEPETEFRVQFKGGKKPLDLGPPVEAPVQRIVEFAQPEPEPEEDVLELVEGVAPVTDAPAQPVPPVVQAPAGKSKAAFTLRLDPQRHLKLRLACAVRGGSAQQLVTDALDRLLASMPELDELADKARQRN